MGLTRCSIALNICNERSLAAYQAAQFFKANGGMDGTILYRRSKELVHLFFRGLSFPILMDIECGKYANALLK